MGRAVERKEGGRMRGGGVERRGRERGKGRNERKKGWGGGGVERKGRREGVGSGRKSKGGGKRRRRGRIEKSCGSMREGKGM